MTAKARMYFYGGIFVGCLIGSLFGEWILRAVTS